MKLTTIIWPSRLDSILGILPRDNHWSIDLCVKYNTGYLAVYRAVCLDLY